MSVTYVFQFDEEARNKDIRRALRQQNPDLDPLVPDSLGHLRALKKRHLEHVFAPSTHTELPQEILQIRIPPDPKTILPPPENRIPRPDLQVRLAEITTKATRRNVPNIVSKIRVQAPHTQRDVQRPQRDGRRAVVGRLGVGDAREVVRESGAVVREPVALFGREVAAPVADFDVPLQPAGVDDGFGEFVAHADGLVGAGGDGAVGAVGEGRALALRVFFVVGVGGGGEDGVFGDVDGGEFEFGFLLQRLVGGGCVGAELVEEVLFVVLVDGCGEGVEGGEDVVGYAEGCLA